MTSSFIPWVSSLGQADPLHIIPLLYAGVTLVSMIIPLTAEITMTGSLLLRTGLPVIMVSIMGIVIWSSPIAVGLYWTTNALFAIMERGFYRTSVGRRLVNKGLPAAST
ncbi:Membrane protein insertase YidC [compost metagenome]